MIDRNAAGLSNFPIGCRVAINDAVALELLGEHPTGKPWSAAYGHGVVKAGLDPNKDPKEYAHQSQAGGSLIIHWPHIKPPCDWSVAPVKFLMRID